MGSIEPANVRIIPPSDSPARAVTIFFLRGLSSGHHGVPAGPGHFRSPSTKMSIWSHTRGGIQRWPTVLTAWRGVAPTATPRVTTSIFVIFSAIFDFFRFFYNFSIFFAKKRNFLREVRQASSTKHTKQQRDAPETCEIKSAPSST